MALHNTHTPMHTCTHTHTMHTHIHAHVHTHTHMMHAHAYTHACTCAHMYTHTHTHIQLQSLNALTQTMRQVSQLVYFTINTQPILSRGSGRVLKIGRGERAPMMVYA